VPDPGRMVHLINNLLKIQSFFLRPGFSKPSIHFQKMELNGTESGVKIDRLDIIFNVISDSCIKTSGENFFFKCNIC
jgi:hypothetical protein